MGYLPWPLQMIKSLQKGLKGANNLYKMQVKWEKRPQICQMISHQLCNGLAPFVRLGPLRTLKSTKY